MGSLELFVELLKPLLFPAFHELSDQVGGGVEANSSSLGTRRKRQGTDEVSFTRSGVSDEQHVFSLIEIFSPQEFPNQWLCSILWCRIPKSGRPLTSGKFLPTWAKRHPFYSMAVWKDIHNDQSRDRLLYFFVSSFRLKY